MKNFLEKKFRRKDQQAEKDKIEKVTGLGRRTGAESNDSPEIPDRGGDIRYSRPPFGSYQHPMDKDDNALQEYAWVLYTLLCCFVVNRVRFVAICPFCLNTNNAKIMNVSVIVWSARRR